MRMRSTQQAAAESASNRHESWASRPKTAAPRASGGHLLQSILVRSSGQFVKSRYWTFARGTEQLELEFLQGYFLYAASCWRRGGRESARLSVFLFVRVEHFLRRAWTIRIFLKQVKSRTVPSVSVLFLWFEYNEF